MSLSLGIGLGLGQQIVNPFGPEKVVNGDFSDGLTGWTQNANATGTANVVAEELVQTSPHGDYAETKQLSQSTIGRTYQVTFEVVSKVDAAILVTFQYGRDTILSSTISVVSLGVHTYEATSTHADGFSMSVRTNGEITIDNVSAKEIL